MEGDSTEWLEAMKGAFDEEVTDGNYAKCIEIVELLKDEGFTADALELRKLLSEETIGTFIHETDERNWK